MKIVVLAGGLSPERDVSFSSGSMIANALMESGHNVLLLDVYEGVRTGESELDQLFRDKSSEPYSYKVPDVEPDLEEIKRRNHNQAALIGQNVLKLCEMADVVFIALHGAMGENGQLQAVLDVMGIRYTGTGYIGSLLAMDKDITKQLFRQAQIPTADWVVVPADASVCDIPGHIGFPCVVKPLSAGSSVGVSIVRTEDELDAAMQYAKKVEAHVLIEKMIPGREFSVGILDGVVLPVIEIIPNQGFYDYKNKYQAGFAREVCPAEIPEEATKRVQYLALRVHQVLRLGSYARIDFIQNNDGEFICLEANTLPGMTPTSLIPQEALAAGISYVDLCNQIVNLAMK